MCDVNRRPTAITLKAFLLIATTPVAFGFVPLPGSLENGPSIFGQTTALAAWLGCLVSLVGLLWPWRKSDALYIEQAGLTLMSIGYGLYAVALLGVDQPANASFAFGLSGGLCLACIVQNVVIGRFRRRRRGVYDGP